MNKKRIFIACADERLRIALVVFLEGEPGLVVAGFTDRLENLVPQLEVSHRQGCCCWNGSSTCLAWKRS